MMREFILALRLARRELRSGLAGFRVFLTCLVIGVAVIAAVKSLSLGLMESIFYDGRYILGGDIALKTIYEPATPEQIRFLHDKMGPLTIVMETRAMARTQDSHDATMVELKAVDVFYPLYGKLDIADEAGQTITNRPLQDFLVQGTIEEFAKGTKEWGALVERELLERLNLHIGDYIYIGDKRFQVSGIIKKEPDRIGALHFAIAPRVMISRNVFDETGLGKQGAQVYYDHKLYLPYAKTLTDLEAAQKKIAEAFPVARWKGRNFMDASPSLRRMVERLTLFLTLIGLTALLIGGVGVGNAVRSFLDERMPTIATLKCLGASGRLIFTVYLTQIMTIALLAVTFGLVLGAGLPLAVAPLLTARLALNNYISIYPPALAMAGFFGIFTVLAFGLWPLGRAVSARASDLFRDLVAPGQRWPGKKTLLSILIAVEALAALVIFSGDDIRFSLWFIGGALTAFVVFYMAGILVQFLARHARKPRHPNMRLAMTNLYRPGNVTTSVILSLGLGLTVLVALTQIENGLRGLIRENTSGETPSFFFLDVQPGETDAFTKTVLAQPGARDLRLIPSLRGRITRVNGTSAETALVNPDHSWVLSSDRGFTWVRDMPTASKITAGAWWPANYQGPPIVSIATDVAQAFDIGVGDTITVDILGREITATVANVRDIDWASFAMNFAITFAPGALDQAPATRIGTVIVDPSAETPLIRKLAKNFPHVTSVRVKDALTAAMTIVSAIGQAVRLSSSLMIVAGALVLAGGIATGHKRRVYDAVILKVLGATRRRILGGFMMEYGLLGLITALIAGGIGTLAAYGVETYILELKWNFGVYALTEITALCLLVTLIAGFLGTWRALGKTPASMLRNQ